MNSSLLKQYKAALTEGNIGFDDVAHVIGTWQSETEGYDFVYSEFFIRLLNGKFAFLTAYETVPEFAEDEFTVKFFDTMPTYEEISKGDDTAKWQPFPYELNHFHDERKVNGLQ